MLPLPSDISDKESATLRLREAVPGLGTTLNVKDGIYCSVTATRATDSPMNDIYSDSLVAMSPVT